MKTITKICALAAFLTAGVCSAQNVKDEPAKFFHLDFVVREVDEGKVINSRSYSMIAGNGKNYQNPSVRTGSKVPIQKGGADGVTFIDLGVSFDCRFVGELGSSLLLGVAADISSIASGSENSASNLLPPVIRQNRWNATVIVPLGKPTTIYSSDDMTSKRKVQIEITATPITT
jgi:hypothetical protein